MTVEEMLPTGSCSIFFKPNHELLLMNTVYFLASCQRRHAVATVTRWIQHGESC